MPVLSKSRERRGSACTLATSSSNCVDAELQHLGLEPVLADVPPIDQLLADLSARFSSLFADQIDDEIELWLRRLSEMLGADRATFAELKSEGFVITHLYNAPGIAPRLKGAATDAFPWLSREFAAARPVVMSRIPDDIPEDAVQERAYFTRLGVRSGIGIPVVIGGAVTCVITFGCIRQARTWPPDVVWRLKIAGDVFGNALSRWQVKQRLDQKQAELAHVGRVAAMGELASVIAHELDQPLTAVVSNAEAVRNMLRVPKPDLAGADDALIEVIDAVMRMSEIVRRERRMLRKSRESFETLDLNDAVREVELFIRAEARRDGAKLTLNLLPGLPPINGDCIQFQQIILNLVRNALQSMRERPRESRQLRIQTSSSTKEVALLVTDNGAGVADDAVLSRMFEPFFTTKSDGLGMGLSISKSIVEAHRGRMWATCNDTAGGGLSVHVTIPRK